MRNDTTSEEAAIYRRVLRRRRLTYGFTVSLIGLPVGLLLHLPCVWGLALLGILAGGIKLHHLKQTNT